MLNWRRRTVKIISAAEKITPANCDIRHRARSCSEGLCHRGRRNDGQETLEQRLV